MKFNPFLVAFATLLFFFGSCKDEDSPVNEDVPAEEEVSFSPEELSLLTEISNGSPKITEAEAMNKALEIANSFSGLTKSGKTKTIKNSLALTIPKTDGTKSSGEVADTVAYVFNFEDNGGYAIAASDIRVPEQILAYTESGELGTYTDNPGLALFLENAETYIAQSIEKAEAQKDSLAQEILKKLNLLADSTQNNTKAFLANILGSLNINTTTTTYYPWERVNMVAPLSVVEWNQTGNPYNKFTKSKGCNGNAPHTGCVAVATAQIMAYWGHPTFIDEHYMFWTDIAKYTDRYSYKNRNSMFNNKWIRSIQDDYTSTIIQDNVARLMERIGSHVGMSYGCDASSANSDNAINWLKSLGYAGGEKSGYDFYRVKSSLDFRRIVYAEGYSLKEKNKFLGITTSTTYKKGHTWNYDGYMQQRQLIFQRTVTTRNGSVIMITDSESYNYRDLVHVNWGWGGEDNGYYVSGAFNKNNGATASSGTKSLKAQEGQDKNYQYNLSIFTNLRR